MKLSLYRFIPNRKDNHGLTPEYLELMRLFLPSFQHPEGSTENHRKIASDHWRLLFQDLKKSKQRSNQIHITSSEDTITLPGTVRNYKNIPANKYRVAMHLDGMHPEERMELLYDTFHKFLELNAPELKPVFKTSKHARNVVLQHIVGGLRTMLAHDVHIERVRALTRTHLQFGVKMEYFDLLGQAVIFSMRHCSGSHWSSEIEEAWRRLYGHCSVILLREHELATQLQAHSQVTNSTDNTVWMGLYHRCFGNKRSKNSKRLAKHYIKLMDIYLPNFRYKETSNDHHRYVAANHWQNVFSSEGSATSSASSTTRHSRQSAREGELDTYSKRLGCFYDTFYEYLERNAPELQPVFRSSIQVRSRVLVHISKEMRILLMSKDLAQRVNALTATHIRVNVKLEHYDTLGQALIHSMRAASGDFWSQEIENAWKRLYAHCSVLLLHEHQRALANAKPKHDQV
uniref:Uncharacterized protein AlNc14C5G666 n=1 Tax=Albugo laibachii Nc14 TaxID=890382 RepID=F0W0M6_9STRA|nr:conserved hypothetical protein [Albugo laibachii Nc14]|eukprot:CCA14598.1 conserved hypothetical protein [Albugo laibachii Nc14]